MNDKIKIGIVGLGKIARDQHVRVLRDHPSFEIIATCDPFTNGLEFPHYQSLSDMIKAHHDIKAVSILTQPQVREDLARDALARGLHVLLEKPPALSLKSAHDLIEASQKSGLGLMFAWHSQFGPVVNPMIDLLTGEKITHIKIVWKEDVHKWHPGQNWIFEEGGMGIFDPTINAFSIVTRLISEPLFAKTAHFETPKGAACPVRALLTYVGKDGLRLDADVDFLQKTGETWDLDVVCDSGLILNLKRGGAVLLKNGMPYLDLPEQEYFGIYTRFTDVVRHRLTDADCVPLAMAEQAFAIAQSVETDPIFL